jgi:hypothetical protein
MSILFGVGFGGGRGDLGKKCLDIVNAASNPNCSHGIHCHWYHECDSLLGSQTIQPRHATTMASRHLRCSHSPHL